MKSDPIRSASVPIIFLSAMLVSSLATAAIKVELMVDSGELKVKSNTGKCNSADADDPCIVVEKGKAPYIHFKLPDACEAGASKPKHKLDSIRITQVDKVWPSPGNPLNATVADDFKADPETGYIKFGGSSNNTKTKKKLKFKNRNSRTYTVFYEITAIPCKDDSDEDDLHLDPEIRNRGGAN